MTTNDDNLPQLQRALNEMIAEKQRETAYAESVKRYVPDLEDIYVRLLQDWENLFTETAVQGQRLLGAASASEDELRDQAAWYSAASKLLGDARMQSAEFTRQLGLLQEHSAAMRNLSILDVQPSLLETALPQEQEQRERLSAPLDPDIADEAEPLSADLLSVDSPSVDPLSADPLSGDLLSVDSPSENPLSADPLSGDPSWRTEAASSWSNPTGDGSAPIIAGETAKAVPIGGHTLPPLPYPYNALEPWIDEKTMRIHHDKHHQSYVDGLNKAEKKLEEARKTGHFDLIKHWERELAFHGAGHYLHTIFWQAMSPQGGGQPSGALANEIDRSFGSFNAFKKQFSEAADKVEGGGWAIAVWSPRSRRLEILTAEKHQNLSQWDVVPLLPLDVWEHAYYLKHQNNRSAYVKDWWNVVNWPYIAERYAQARTLQWAPH